MQITPRTISIIFQLYVNNVIPPMKAPSERPILTAAWFNDIIVPLKLGTCSKLRLLVAASLNPPKKLPAIDRTKEIQNNEMFVNRTVNNPIDMTPMIVSLFLPYLFTILPLNRLPDVKLNARPDNRTAAHLVGI